jgi:SAM-dependent methyltransferase
MSELSALFSLLRAFSSHYTASERVDAAAVLALAPPAADERGEGGASMMWEECAPPDAARLAALSARITATGPPKSPFWAARIIACSARSWDAFYGRHEDRFFLPRNYVERDFPALLRAAGAPFSLLEFGCGTGACLLPLLARLPRLLATGFDLSARAVALAVAGAAGAGVGDRLCAFPCDATAGGARGIAAAVAAAHGARVPGAPPLLAPGARGFDAALLLFMLSAVPPEAHRGVVRAAAECLRPGGLLLLRDYGEGDEAQGRFGAGARLTERGDVMVRRDGTLAAFLSLAALRAHAAAAGLEETGWAAAGGGGGGSRYLHRRYRNRATGEELQRVFVHAVWRKPLAGCAQ